MNCFLFLPFSFELLAWDLSIESLVGDYYVNDAE